PIGAGDRHLYPVKVQIRQGPAILAERNILIGFRSVDWAGDGALLVNGRPVPIKATEWMPEFCPDSEQAVLDDLGKILSANLNAVWVRTPDGFESDRFYDICDEAGILILQEIPAGGARLDQNRVLNLEEHACMVAWTQCKADMGDAGKEANPPSDFNHMRPVLPVFPFGEQSTGIPVLSVPAAPHPQTWEDLLDEDERWPMPASWRLIGPDADALEASIPKWGTAESYTDYSLLSQSIQAELFGAAIEQTRIAAPGSGRLITGRLLASWPGLSPALFDALRRPSIGFWRIKRSWEPDFLSLRRTEERFEAWVVNMGPETITAGLTVFDALDPASGHRSVAGVSVPSGTAALVWSSTEESWAERAFREGDLQVLGAIAGEPISIAELTKMALSSAFTTSSGESISSAELQSDRDPRLPPILQTSLFCAAPAEIDMPTTDLHVITFGEDNGPWRVTIRPFGRKYLRQVRLTFDPPDAAYASDQFFDIVPDSGRLVTIQAVGSRRDPIRVIVIADNAEPVAFHLMRE
ncbi:MAG: hypothetical protein ABIH23_10565, partial [bacterium]